MMNEQTNERTNERTDICDCRVAFATENSTDSEMTNVSHGEEAKTADKISTDTEMTNVSESHKGEAKIAQTVPRRVLIKKKQK